MAQNIAPKAVQIEIEGKSFDMLFTNKGIRYLQDKYGSFKKALHAIDSAEMDGETDYDVVANVVYAGLMVNKVVPGVEVIKEWLDNMPMMEGQKFVRGTIPQAITGALPVQENEEKNG